MLLTAESRLVGETFNGAVRVMVAGKVPCPNTKKELIIQIKASKQTFVFILTVDFKAFESKNHNVILERRHEMVRLSVYNNTA